MFENFNARKISLEDAKRILNKNWTTYSDEEVKRIVDYLYTLAELEWSVGKTRTKKNASQHE